MVYYLLLTTVLNICLDKRLQWRLQLTHTLNIYNEVTIYIFV